MESRENRQFAYEIKFLIPSGHASMVRDWARRTLDPDPHAGGETGDRYRITSLYFDTPGFGVFHKQGSHGRAKYRIRRYDQAPTVFLERKLRSNGIVTKRRTLIPIEMLSLLDGSNSDWKGEWFRRRVAARGMAPSCQISYVRTALVGTCGDGLVRFTIDDGLCAARVMGASYRPLAACTPIQPGHSIVEMKFRMAMPAAFKAIVEEFRLYSRPISKYRLALPVLGMAHDAAPFPILPEEPVAAYA